MSSNCYIEPAKRDKKKLSKEFKFALEKGEIYTHFPTTIGIEALDYFKGMYAGGIDDAKDVVSMLEQHNYVVLSCE